MPAISRPSHLESMKGSCGDVTCPPARLARVGISRAIFSRNRPKIPGEPASPLLHARSSMPIHGTEMSPTPCHLLLACLSLPRVWEGGQVPPRTEGLINHPHFNICRPQRPPLAKMGPLSPPTPPPGWTKRPLSKSPVKKSPSLSS